jgi:N-acetylglucosamine-6-phosphate deacetylase
MYALHADRFYLPGAPLDGGYLVIEDDGTFGWWQEDAPTCEVRDYSGKSVAPGLVDTHIHGSLDHDVMDCDWAGVDAINHGLVKNGVTSWTPTTLTASTDQLTAACASIGDNYTYAPGAAGAEGGARVQGIFLEGPFFTEKHKGAQNPAYMGDPKIEILDGWQQAAHGLVTKIAIAAERDGAPEFCAEASAEGVAVAIGHSDAGYLDTIKCVNAGASVFVHTYNGMSPLHHREPGVVGTAMTSRNTYAEMICDGHHLNPIAVRALVGAKGWDHCVLITDCMRAGGMPDGDYTLGEFPVIVGDGMARLKDGGSLAGSILTLDKAVKNVVEWGVVTFEQALRMATEQPARANNIEDICGSILPGRDADLSVWNPDMTIAETIIGGKVVYQA